MTQTSIEIHAIILLVCIIVCVQLLFLITRLLVAAHEAIVIVLLVCVVSQLLLAVGLVVVAGHVLLHLSIHRVSHVITASFSHSRAAEARKRAVALERLIKVGHRLSHALLLHVARLVIGVTRYLRRR